MILGVAVVAAVIVIGELWIRGMLSGPRRGRLGELAGDKVFVLQEQEQEETL